MKSDSRVLITGGEGFIGSAIKRALERENHVSVSTPQVDWSDASAVLKTFEDHNPEFVFHAAGPSAGIQENIQHPASLMLPNLRMGINVVETSVKSNVTKLINVASSCVYPRQAPQPLREEYLMSGPFEPTNEAYATSKMAIMKLCQASNKEHGVRYITLIPANPFGPGDDFDPGTGHVITAMINRMSSSTKLGDFTVLGSGKPRRDFLYVDDLADAAVFVMNNDRILPEAINVSAGLDLSIADLARHIQKVVGFVGELKFDDSKPDGMPVKLIDGSLLKSFGWKPKVALDEGLRRTFEWFKDSRR